MLVNESLDTWQHPQLAQKICIAALSQVIGRNVRVPAVSSPLPRPSTAIFPRDLTRQLVYSTISHLVLISLLRGPSMPRAVVAGLLHLINHTCFEASLVMPRIAYPNRFLSTRCLNNTLTFFHGFNLPLLTRAIAQFDGSAGHSGLARQHRISRDARVLNGRTDSGWTRHPSRHLPRHLSYHMENDRSRRYLLLMVRIALTLALRLCPLASISLT